MRVLAGTGNPSKARRFGELLAADGVEVITTAALGIGASPEETGGDPIQNAVIKARFYGRYFDPVICNDSGLYFDCLPLDDPRQPGLHIRAPRGKRLSDDEMLEYYAALARELGGKALAYYMDGIAVYRGGEVYTFLETREEMLKNAFYMVDKPSPLRHEGWPLDSISLYASDESYFVEAGESTAERDAQSEYFGRLRLFLLDALGIQNRRKEGAQND